MLSPETWDFKPPESKFIVESIELDDITILRENIEKLLYSHLVSVVLPDTLQVPKDLSNILLSDCEYYKIIDVNIGDLLHKNFINNFIKKGYFTALSINTRIDCDDCVCITPNGILVLSLTKETYQTLGLEGKLSRFSQRSRDRYIVNVDVLKDYFKPGKKNYERTKLCLTKLKGFTLIINWAPFKEDICPSSIAKYFHDLSYEVKSCIPDFKTRTEYSIKVPEGFSVQNANEFVEWLGAFSVQSDLNSGSPDNYLTTYETPDPSIQCGQIKFLEWKGFFMPNQIERLSKMLLEYMNSEQKPWISLYVQGFSDSPIIGQHQENHYFTNSDNSYAVLIDSSKCLICRQSCSQKYYKHV